MLTEGRSLKVMMAVLGALVAVEIAVFIEYMLELYEDGVGDLDLDVFDFLLHLI